MYGLKDYHTKLSNSEIKRQIPYGVIYMWNLKYNTNELTYETETDTEKKLTVTKGRSGWGRDKLGGWEYQIHTTIYKIDK